MLIQPITINEFPKLDSKEVNLLIADIQLLAHLEIELDIFLNIAELKRYTSFYFQKDKDLFLLSRYMLKTVLVDSLQCDFSEIELVANDFGKPGIKLANNLSFNLSHSGCLVVLVISHNGFELGVDVEKHTSAKQIMDIAHNVFTKREIAQLEILEKNLLIEKFYFLWTLKEAVIKADGQGLSLDLKSFEFEIKSDRLLMNVLSNDQLSQYCWQFVQILLSSGYSLALALRTDYLMQQCALIKCYQLVPTNNNEKLISARQSFTSNNL